MDQSLVFSLLYAGAGVVFLLIIILSRRARRHGGAFRAGVVGAMYEWQNKDKQEALNVIVEGKAAETRPEYPDGDLHSWHLQRRSTEADKATDKGRKCRTRRG